jgi:hypothetical protein
LHYSVNYLHSLQKYRPAFIVCYNETSDVSMGSSFVGDKLQKYSIRWMKLLPGSRRPTHSVHDPIQPALLEFSQEFDALYIHYVGKLNDSGLMPSWKQACKTDRLDTHETEHVGCRTRTSVSRGLHWPLAAEAPLYVPHESVEPILIGTAWH